MINKLLGLAVALALPTLVAAQTPASRRKVTVELQGQSFLFLTLPDC